MQTVSVQDLELNLSDLLDRVACGERVIVTRRNRPIAELGPPTRPGHRVGARFGDGHLGRAAVTLAPGVVREAVADDRADER